MTVLDEIRNLLLAPHGTDQLNPARVFSTATPVERIAVRIDDQLARMDGSFVSDEPDDVRDLIVQLVLLRAAYQTTLWNQWADDNSPIETERGKSTH